MLYFYCSHSLACACLLLMSRGLQILGFTLIVNLASKASLSVSNAHRTCHITLLHPLDIYPWRLHSVSKADTASLAASTITQTSSPTPHRNLFATINSQPSFPPQNKQKKPAQQQAIPLPPSSPNSHPVLPILQLPPHPLFQDQDAYYHPPPPTIFNQHQHTRGNRPPNPSPPPQSLQPTPAERARSHQDPPERLHRQHHHHR